MCCLSSSGLPAARSTMPLRTSRRVFSTAAASSSTSPASSFLHANGAYVDEMFLAWRSDPNSVHKSWDAYFRNGSYTAPPTLVSDTTTISSGPVSAASTGGAARTGAMGGGPLSATAAKILGMVRAFQVRGHLLANLDPLGMMPPRPDHEDLKLENYGFSDADLDREIDVAAIGEFLNMKGFLDRERGKVTLRKLYKRLTETYASSIGYEFMHIPSVEKCNWIREKIETRDQLVFSKEAKLQLLDRLTWADHFENFLKVSNLNCCRTSWWIKKI